MSGGLTPEQVKAILAKPQKKARTRKGIDTSVRDLVTWFALAPKAMDENYEQNLKCDNPNCLDPRPPQVTSTGIEIKRQHVINIDGQYLCRYCFLAGWLLADPAQTSL